MPRTKKISHSIQRKRLHARCKNKVNSRRLVQFIQDNHAEHDHEQEQDQD